MVFENHQGGMKEHKIEEKREMRAMKEETQESRTLKNGMQEEVDETEQDSTWHQDEGELEYEKRSRQGHSKRIEQAQHQKRWEATRMKKKTSRSQDEPEPGRGGASY